MSPNTEFKLSVKDIELIENALLSQKQTQEIQDLLGRLHNQKTWYRPKEGVYIGG